MSFDALKANRASSISKLVTAASKINTGKTNYEDDRFWKPTLDKAGNGYAVIRFLPACEGDDLPWVRYWDHGFKGKTGRWYIENSLTSINLPDPVSEYNTTLWNTGIEADKATARLQKRRLHYVANILVVSDPSNPSNEGKVFLYKFGAKIWDKCNDAMNPPEVNGVKMDEPFNPFDFWTGASFKLKIREVEGWSNYDKSEFDKATELFKGDEARLKEVYDSLKPLRDFLDPKNYKSYEELKKKFAQVLGSAMDPDAPGSAEQAAPRSGRTTSAPDKHRSSEAPEPASDDSEDENQEEEKSESVPEGKGTLSYFAKLAQQK